MEPNTNQIETLSLTHQISGVSTKLNEPTPHGSNHSSIQQNVTIPQLNLSRNSSVKTLNIENESLRAPKSCKDFNKSNLYSKPFFKSNFKFLDKNVKSKALDILKKRKKLRNLTIVQKKLQSTYQPPVSKNYTLDSVIKKVKSSKQTISQGRNLISSLENNLRMIEKELVVMKTQD